MTDRDSLAALIFDQFPDADELDDAENAADAILAAGWRASATRLETLDAFHAAVTNALGMALVHEDGEPDLGYDRGIADAMDIVNGTFGGPDGFHP